MRKKGKYDGGEAKREVRELALLHEISRLLDESLDLRRVAAPLLASLAEHMGMHRGTLTLFQPESGEILIEAAHGMTEVQVRRGRYRLGEGMIGKVVRTGLPAVVPKVSEEPLFLHRAGALKDLAKKDVSFVCVPIKIGNEVVGTLSADRLFALDVDLEEDVRLLSILASMIAQAVRLRREAQRAEGALREENARLRAELSERFQPASIIGNSPRMQEVYDLIAQVSRSDATVLIRGETGTGKELVAHAVHYAGARAAKPFVKVNSSALPESLIESELFGHEKGAFTGATERRRGRFEMAHGGTLFLDEVGDLPPTTQVRLLRVLAEGEFERVGGSETLRTDARVIAATHKDLEAACQENSFRSDLYYRLNVFPIYLPPLRERKSDIPLLIDHFLAKFAERNTKVVKRISTPAIDMLMAYHWPGNIRELENALERAVLVAEGEVVHAHHLPATLQTAESSGTVFRGTLPDAVARLERAHIEDALKVTRGRAAKAAKLLGLTERQIGVRIQKYGIEAGRFRS